MYESRLEELENERSEKCVETDAKVVTLGHNLDKIEKGNLEKCTNYETKLDGVIFGIKCLKKEEIKLSEDVSNLETEKKQVLKMIDLIDSTLKAIN